MKDINTFFKELGNDPEAFQHCQNGCIPTCVRNVLKFYDIKNQNGNEWSQKDVMEYFNSKIFPPQNIQCPCCKQFYNEMPTFRIMKEFENYPPFGKKYQAKISPDEDDKEVKEKVLESGTQLRDYILKNLFEIVVSDTPRPVLVSLMPPEIGDSHICIVTGLNDHEVHLFDPGDRVGFIKKSREWFDALLNLRNKSDYSRICYVYNR